MVSTWGLVFLTSVMYVTSSRLPKECGLFNTCWEHTRWLMLPISKQYNGEGEGESES